MAAAANCAECGVVESVREVDAKGLGSGLGAVGGGVLGGLLGNQVGAGRGKDVMTVVGVVGGAVAGNEVEKRVKGDQELRGHRAPERRFESRHQRSQPAGLAPGR